MPLRDIAPLTEPVPIFDVYTDGICRLDNLGGTCRVTFFTNQFDPEHHKMKRVICAKMVWPADTLLRHGGRLAKYVAEGFSGELPPPGDPNCGAGAKVFN